MTEALNPALARQAVLGAARRFLDGDLSLLGAADTIARAASVLDPEMVDEFLLGFVAISSEGDHVVPADRLALWHPDLRGDKLRQAERFEALYLEGARHDAAALLARYGPA